MSSPPEVFCDRSLGRYKVPERLRELLPVVHAHDELFAQDVDDEVWLRTAGERRWIVLTRDDQIRYRPAEQQALLESGAAVFCLHPSKGMTADEWAEALATAMPRIIRIFRARPSGGYIMGVNRKGQVRQLFPAR